jgi:hypothetical protein
MRAAGVRRGVVQFEIQSVVPWSLLWETDYMNESLRDAFLRIIRKSEKCLSAAELANLRDKELGGGSTIAPDLVHASLNNLPPDVYKSGDGYCHKP